MDFLNADGGYDISGDYGLKEIDLAALGIKRPGGICVYNDSIYVCDISNNCIVKLNKDLVKEATYGTLGMEEGNFSEPRDIVFMFWTVGMTGFKNLRRIFTIWKNII